MSFMAAINEKISGLFADERFLEPLGPPTVDEPIIGMLPYRAYDEESGLFINSSSCGFMLEVSPLSGATEETVNMLSAAFSDVMPDNSSLQVMCWASPHIGEAIDKWSDARNTAPGVYRMLAKRRSKFFADGGWKSPLPGTDHLLRDFRVFIAGSAPGPIEKNRDALTAASRKLSQAMIGIGATATALDPEEFLSIVDEWIRPLQEDRRESVVWRSIDPMHYQLSHGESSITVHPTRLIFSATHDVRCLSVHSWPESWTQWQGNNLIGSTASDFQRISCPFLTSFSFSIGTDSSDSTRAGLKATRATQQASTPLSTFMPMIHDQAREWKQVARRVHDGHRLARCYYQVVSYAPLGTGDEAEQQVRSLYKANGWRLSLDRYVQLQSFLNALPFFPSEGMVNELQRLGRVKTLLTDTCANVAPMQGEWKGTPSPCMLLFGRRGQPFYWDPFDNTQGNYNVAVVGTSGSGKSVFMQEMVSSIVGAGGRVIVIDDGYSFKNSCILQGGDFVEFSGDSEICLNPFSVVDAAAVEADQEYRESVMAMISGLVQQMCRVQTATDDLENSEIKEAIAKVWAAKGTSGEINDVGLQLEKAGTPRTRDLASLLRPCMRGGIYERYWNGKCTLSINSALSVFELSEIKARKDLQGLVMMMMMFLAAETMYHGDRGQKSAIVIDEAWDLLHGPASKIFIEGLARRARKYNGSLITGTQSVNDYYKNEAALASFENTDWVCFLAQKNNSIDTLKNSGRMTFDANMERDLKSVKRSGEHYSEVMITGPDGYGIGRLILDRFSVKLYSSTADDVKAICALQDEGMSLTEAVEHLSMEAVNERT